MTISAKYGENLYDAVNGGQLVASNARVEQGALETSNINVVSEMVDMITITRAYEGLDRRLSRRWIQHWTKP